MISTSPSKQAMIKGDTWAMGAPVCSCKISQLTLGSYEMRIFRW
jgi:hypothetical protein